MLEVLFIMGAREYFHAHHITSSDLTREQVVYQLAGRGAGVAEELYPGGGVDENHEFR